jgi:hypothetical protein
MEKKSLTLEEMQELVDNKANELAGKLGRKVLPLLFNEKGEWIVGYIQQPTRSAVRQAVDKIEKFGRIEAGDFILQTSLIKEESDVRITEERPEFDGINMGACLAALDLIEVNISVIKKNTNNIE